MLKPYKDVAGLRTIGVGHLIRPDENFPDGTEITLDVALELLAADVKKCELAISKTISASLGQEHFDALVSFGFNCGTGVYSTSTACKALNDGDIDGFCDGLMMWNKAKVNGIMKVVPGLTARRRAECQLFLSGGAIQKSEEVKWTKELLSEVQTSLHAEGLYTKNIDGIWGQGTDAAIKAYASKMGMKPMEPTSRGISQEMLKRLREKI